MLAMALGRKTRENVECVRDSRRIIAARVPGMAPTNSPYAAPAPANRTIFFYTPDEIGAASWLKPAISANQRTQRPLIHACGSDQQRSRKSPEVSRHAIHDAVTPSLGELVLIGDGFSRPSSEWMPSVAATLAALALAPRKRNQKLEAWIAIGEMPRAATASSDFVG